MSTIGTHVLDTALGRPAEGIRVHLEGADGTPIAQGITDHDGRLKEIGGLLAPGSYRLPFEVGAYFRRTNRESFYDEVPIAFRLTGDPHYHVPLLLSPFGYSTYRGS